MGPTGSGKTNVSGSVPVISLDTRIKNDQFVNKLTGNAEKAKAGDLSSATKSVTPYAIPLHGLRLVVVDTPGFDNSHQADTETLRRIADWLTKRYVTFWPVSDPPDGMAYTKISRRRHTQAHWNNLPSPNH